MKPFVLLAAAFCLLSTAGARADDYLVRLETVGYVDQPVSVKNPKETVLRSIEIIARPNVPFRTKVITGPQTLILSGELRPAEDGNFTLQIRHSHLVDSGNRVPTKHGGEDVILDTTECLTTLTVSLSEPVLIGGMQTQVSNSGKPELRSKEHAVVRLTKYQPTKD